MHGLRAREIDLSGVAIAGMERLGLVSDVVRISPERVREREQPHTSALSVGEEAEPEAVRALVRAGAEQPPEIRAWPLT